MKPGDVATMSMQGTLTLNHSESLSAHQAWKQRLFMFENTPVSEIAYHISEHFGVNVVVARAAFGQGRLQVIFAGAMLLSRGHRGPPGCRAAGTGRHSDCAVCALPLAHRNERHVGR